MTYIELAIYLSHDYKVKEIAKKENLSEKHIQRKIREMKRRCNKQTYWGVIADYLRKQLIQ